MIESRADISSRVFVILLAVLLATSLAMGLGSVFSARALETHEIFVAQTSREMIAGGDFVVPRFGGEMRLKKPPLMYWAVVGVAKVAGRPDVPEWAARLPSALAAMVLVAACVAIGAGVYDRRTGLLAGALVAFSGGVFLYGGNARPEMLYAACTGVSAAGFVLAGRYEKRSLALAMLGWAGMGLAILAKGPQLPVMVFVGLSAWMVYERGWRGWCRMYRPAWGVGLALLIAAPWVVMVMLRVEDAAGVWKRELIGLRFEIDADDARAGETSGFVSWMREVLNPRYLGYCASMLAPWGLMMPVLAALAWWGRRQDGVRPDVAAERGVFCGLAAAVIGLSLATHSRDYYLLPVLPLLGVLTARGMVEVLDRARGKAWAEMVWMILLGIFAIAGIGFGVGVQRLGGWTTGGVVAVAMWVGVVGALTVTGVRQARLNRTSVALAAAIAGWAIGYGAAVMEPAFFGERRRNWDEIARAAAAMAWEGGGGGGAAQVVAIVIDPNDLIYRVNRPIRALDATASAAEVRAAGAGVVVAPTEVLDRLSAEGLAMSAREVIVVQKKKPIGIARVGVPRE